MRKRFDVADPGGTRNEEIVAEIAGHLEDLCAEKRAQGVSESDAVKQTLDEVPDWRRLAREIRRTERQGGAMNDRTKRFWLPGFITLAASMGLPLVLLQGSARFAIDWGQSKFWFLPYVLWFAVQPLCGALGAIVSRRGGGRTGARIASSLFPSGVMLFVTGFVLATSILIERNQFVIHHPMYVVMGGLASSFSLGLALLVGALPFLRTQTQRVWQRADIRRA